MLSNQRGRRRYRRGSKGEREHEEDVEIAEHGHPLDIFAWNSEIAFIRLSSSIAAVYLFLYFAIQTEVNGANGILALGFFLVASFQVINGYFGFWNAEKEVKVGDAIFPSTIVLSAILLAGLAPLT